MMMTRFSEVSTLLRGAFCALLLFLLGPGHARAQDSSSANEPPTVSAGKTGTPALSASIEHLHWLTGTWLLEDGDHRAVEHWIEPEGGIMLGVHRDVRSGQRAFFEYLRIEQTGEGTIQYNAAPMGKHETVFTIVEFRKNFVRFENPAHDFPQRIEYELTGADELTARIAAQDGSGMRSWIFQRAR